jgi:hypothetical protein
MLFAGLAGDIRVRLPGDDRLHCPPPLGSGWLGVEWSRARQHHTQGRDSSLLSSTHRTSGNDRSIPAITPPGILHRCLPVCLWLAFGNRGWATLPSPLSGVHETRDSHHTSSTRRSRMAAVSPARIATGRCFYPFLESSCPLDDDASMACSSRGERLVPFGVRYRELILQLQAARWIL